MAKIINIKWETDGEDVTLPNEMELPSNIDADDFDAIDNYLSDETGWLVESYELDCY